MHHQLKPPCLLSSHFRVSTVPPAHVLASSECFMGASNHAADIRCVRVVAAACRWILRVSIYADCMPHATACSARRSSVASDTSVGSGPSRLRHSSSCWHEADGVEGLPPPQQQQQQQHQRPPSPLQPQLHQAEQPED